jgi:hypothetical protein
VLAGRAIERRQTSDVPTERHRDRLGIDQPMGYRQIFMHARAVDVETGDNVVHTSQRAATEHAYLGQHLPFRVSAADPALVFLRHCRQHRRHERRHPQCRGQYNGRIDGVALAAHYYQ